VDKGTGRTLYRIKPEPPKNDTDEIYIIESRPNTVQGVWNFGCYTHCSTRKEVLEEVLRAWSTGPHPNAYQHRITRMVRAEGGK
jgi:hypothetical protein